MGGPFVGGRSDNDIFGVGSGAAIFDAENDGDLDIVIIRYNGLAQLRGGPALLLRNMGGDVGGFPRFVQDPDFSQHFDGRKSHGVAAGDYDADGDLDLFISCSGPDMLLRNRGDGRFDNVTEAAGVGGVDLDVTTSALWADLNSDGMLDLYAGGHVIGVTPNEQPQTANRLYLNRGGGLFERWRLASAEGSGSTHVVMAGDVDGDGETELLVANDRFSVDGEGGVPQLQGDSFVDPTSIDGLGRPFYAERGEELGVTTFRSSMGLALSDLDGDGRDDIFISDWGRNAMLIWSPSESRYVNLADSYNLELRSATELNLFIAWGAHFIDLDRDGRDELMVVHGHVEDNDPPGAEAQRDVLLRRRSDFEPFGELPIPFDAGSDSVQGRAAVFGDLDGDGDEDMIVTPFVGAFRFYRNDTPARRHRLRLRLRGTVSAIDPVGARVEVLLPNGARRHRNRYGGGEVYSTHSDVLEIGLDRQDEVSEAWVHWPSGLRQRIDTLPQFAVDTLFEVEEPRWLSVTPRTVEPGAAALFIYEPPEGETRLGRQVLLRRGDDQEIPVTAQDDGRYSALIPHPGEVGITGLEIEVDGQLLRPRPVLRWLPE